MNKAVVKSMNKAVIESNDTTKPPWGVANPLRGTSLYTNLAVKFVTKYPIGTRLDVEEFDAWLQECGLLTVPPDDVPKSSDAWMGHLQRRHQHRNKLNKAATHPRMHQELSSVAFFLAGVSGGRFYVQATSDAFIKDNTAKQVETLVHYKKRQLNYLMQSHDWKQLPVLDQNVGIEIYADIKYMNDTVKAAANHLADKLSRWERKIQQAIESGQIKPQNGALRRMLAESELTDYDEEDGTSEN